MFCWLASHTAETKFENAALFLRLGSPFTLIRLENGAFGKRLVNPEEFVNTDLVWKEKNIKNGAFQKRLVNPEEFVNTDLVWQEKNIKNRDFRKR